MANGSIAVRVDVLNLEPVKKLHEAVCQAVALLNRAPELARSNEGREAHTLLRQALVDVADAYMNAPVSEHERAAVAAKHQRKPRRASYACTSGAAQPLTPAAPTQRFAVCTRVFGGQPCGMEPPCPDCGRSCHDVPEGA